MSLRRLVYVFGQPGAGKTTVVDYVTEDWRPSYVPEPVPHQAWWRDSGNQSEIAAVTLGRARERFGGTDTLAMNIQPRVVVWLAGRHLIPPPMLVLGEGDRLANARFFDAVREAGWDLQLVWLDTPDVVAAERRAGRGSNQNETWLRGRATKTRRLASLANVIHLNGLADPAQNAAVIRQLLDT